MFASFAPADNPRFAVDAVFEQSGYGADVAAPAVAQEYKTLFGLNKPAPQGHRHGTTTPARRPGTGTTAGDRHHDEHGGGRLMAYTTLPRPAPSATTSVPRRPVASPAWRHVDVLLVAATAGHLGPGRAHGLFDHPHPPGRRRRQPAVPDEKAGSSTPSSASVAFIATVFFDYKRYLSWAPVLYVGSLLLLLATLVVGRADAGRHLVDPGRQHPGRAVRDSQGEPGPVPRRPAGQPQGRPSRGGCCSSCWPVRPALPAHLQAGRPGQRHGAGRRDDRDAADGAAPGAGT